ncbi:MAG: imidazolonepropionase [Prevotellaceae bacterium]|jgi:imidazolonepropionase|nr:imidazolonepropionase [Prevotellaceae bacterium]
MLIRNIKKLVAVETRRRAKVAGADMGTLACIEEAFLLIKEGLIADFGPMQDAPVPDEPVIDATGRMVFPAFCDSHTHVVYAGSRELEYMDKIRGLSYEEIARRGGGILHSVKRLHDTTEEALYREALARVDEMMTSGTGAVEIKSGYGLSVEDELKMLRVVRRLKESSPLTVRATFLGAHAVPAAYIGRRTEYVDAIINDMLPPIAAEGLADYVDVFCERGFFTVEDTERILTAARTYGLGVKVHANQLSRSGGIQAGVKYGAVSVDHLDFTGEEEIDCLKQADTMPVLLPGSNFFLSQPYPPARAMIDAGLPVALASNYNPGSSPSGDMKFVLSLACIQMQMTPEEAIQAATLNGAYAMGLSDTHGSISRGKIANVFITKPVPTIEFIPYAFTSPLVDTLILNGQPEIVAGVRCGKSDGG